jgi:hypothetical protein
MCEGSIATRGASVTKRSRFVGKLAVVLGLAAAGCTSGEGPPQAKPVSSAETAKPDDFDRDAYCNSLCERSAACGVEEATSLAGKIDKSALEKATGDREGAQKECVASCGQSQLPPYRLTQAKSALACTKKESCEAYATCLEEVAAN